MKEEEEDTVGLFNKKELKRIEELGKTISELNTLIEKVGAKSYVEVQKMTEQAKLNFEAEKEKAVNEIQELNDKKSNLLQEIKNKNREIDAAKKELFDINDELMMQSFGIYTPKYDCMNSEEYSNRIKENREKQKALVKSKKALSYYDEWILDGSRSKGRALNDDNMKMVLRAFNNECDVLINKVKFNNIDKIVEQIQKCAVAIDKLNQRNRISIKSNYIALNIRACS